MNGIDRRGQKVICICGMDVWDMQGRAYTGETPREREIYTVTDFLPSRMIVDGEGMPEGGYPGITLAEIPSLRTKSGAIIGWPLMGFVPVNERKTDIGDLLALGRSTPAKQTEPA